MNRQTFFLVCKLFQMYFCHRNQEQQQTNAMKKLLLIIGIVFSLFAMNANAEKTKQEVNVDRTRPAGNTNVNRVPIALPSVGLVFDTDDRSINVTCSCDCDAEVTVYDAAGNIVAMSDIKDTIFVPSSNNGPYYVVIEAEYWYGTATIKL